MKKHFYSGMHVGVRVSASILTVLFAYGPAAHGQIYNKWLVSYGGTSALTDINSSKLQLKDLRLGDFDGDGKTDVFASWQGQWHVSYSGTGPWTYLNSSNLGVDDIALADFNGDGKADVFATWGGQWHISYGGTTAWQTVNGLSFTISKLRFGDFNGDGKADVFAAWDGHWHVSYGATSSWQTINGSSFGIDDIWLGDFNGDGKSDVFAAWDGHWHISYGGTGAWQTVNGSSFGLDDLRFYDFNGDGKTDVFAAWGGHWYVSFSATSGWQQINTSPVEVSALRFGDFNGDHKGDAFTVLHVPKTIELSIRRHVKGPKLSAEQADGILASASSVLQVNDGPGDEVCDIQFVRSGPIGTFDVGTEIIHSDAELAALLDIPGKVKVVLQIQSCNGYNPHILGCSPSPGKVQVVTRETTMEGILWAHEYGHTRGLGHRDDPYALMNSVLDEQTGNTHRRVNHNECVAFQK